MAMRVHVYLPEFPPRGDRLYTGMIKAVHGLATGFVNNGAKVTILCEGRQTSAFNSPCGYDIRSFVNEGITGSGIPRLLERYIDQCDDPGVLLLNGSFSPKVYHVSRACVRNRIPYIVAPHDPYHPSIFAMDRHLKWPYWYLRERPMLSQAKAIQVLDFRHAEWLRALGVKTPIIDVLKGYAPEDVHPESALSWRLEGAPRLLCMGRIDSYSKGLDLLLDAFSQMLHQTDAALTLQGPDWGDRDAMKRRALNLNLGTRVQFRDPDFEKPAALIAAEHDILLLPSRFEGFGLSALEAMLAGRVVLVSDIAGISPHVRASGCGIVISSDIENIKSGLNELLAMRPKWKEMGMAGREYVLRHLRWPRIATEALRQYREMFASPSAQTPAAPVQPAH